MQLDYIFIVLDDIANVLGVIVFLLFFFLYFLARNQKKSYFCSVFNQKPLKTTINQPKRCPLVLGKC